MKASVLFVLSVFAMSALASEITHSREHMRMPMSMPIEEAQPPETNSVPEPTAVDRQNAFPDLDGMDLRKMMDTPILMFTQAERLEWFEPGGDSGFLWDVGGWIGTDNHRLWWRSEGEHVGGETDDAELQLLYGKPIARWWDTVVGLRYDFPRGHSRPWLAAGFQGLAPYWFETEVTLFVADDGQTQLRAQVEYELLLTQRLILQPLLEINAFAKDRPNEAEGAGLANSESGIRLRYEILREFAPYVGVTWKSVHGKTANMLRSTGQPTRYSSVVVGLRLWF